MINYIVELMADDDFYSTEFSSYDDASKYAQESLFKGKWLSAELFMKEQQVSFTRRVSKKYH